MNFVLIKNIFFLFFFPHNNINYFENIKNLFTPKVTTRPNMLPETKHFVY